MRLILEDKVTLRSLVDHLDDSGQTVEAKNDEYIIAHSDKGLGFKIYLDTDRKFIIFRKFFNLKSDFMHGLEFCNALNNEIVVGKFALDPDMDIDVSYHMSYERGIITAQLMRIYLRFASMLDYLVAKDTDNTIFDFNKKSPTPCMIDPPPSIQ